MLNFGFLVVLLVLSIPTHAAYFSNDCHALPMFKSLGEAQAH